VQAAQSGKKGKPLIPGFRFLIANETEFPIVLVEDDRSGALADRALDALRYIPAGILLPVLVFANLVTSRDVKIPSCLMRWEGLADLELFVRDKAGPLAPAALEDDHDGMVTCLYVFPDKGIRNGSESSCKEILSHRISSIITGN